jgi:rare lipoprotein A
MSVWSQVTAGIYVLFPMAFAAAKLLGDKKLGTGSAIGGLKDAVRDERRIKPTDSVLTMATSHTPFYRPHGRSIMSARHIPTIPLLLVFTWFGGVAIAAPSQGGCPGGSMNATQYSAGSGTASGQTFRPDGLTAAHKKLPFGTRVKLTNPQTGSSTIVTINDRGPFTRGRDIDLSPGAARAIGLTSVGTICAEVL